MRFFISFVIFESLDGAKESLRNSKKFQKRSTLLSTLILIK